MDNIKFGKFVSLLRKEKGWTQAELAERINVTDKAISKWERGLGFPDIKLIEPLAEALDVSILEIMRSEKNDSNQMSQENVSEALTNVIDVVEYQRKIEHRNIIISAIALALVIMTVFLIDTMQLEGFFMVCLPIIMLGVGIILTVISINRWKQKLSFKTTLICGILALIFPIMILLFLFFAFLMGGPVQG